MLCSGKGSEHEWVASSGMGEVDVVCDILVGDGAQGVYSDESERSCEDEGQMTKRGLPIDCLQLSW